MMKILYQDEKIVAVDKKSGIITHRNEWSRKGELAALQMVRNLLSQKVYPVHRLDRSTSGVIVFAKSSQYAKEVKCLFDEGKVKKTYLGLIRGWMHETKSVEKELDGKKAKSLIEPLAHFTSPIPVGKYDESRYTWARMFPFSGRYHQLRRHCVHLRHPIIGDSVHGDSSHNRIFKDRHGYRRLWLFASEISFISYGVSNLTIRCPIDADCRDFLTRQNFSIPSSTGNSLSNLFG